jgi:hypothetical protein
MTSEGLQLSTMTYKTQPKSDVSQNIPIFVDRNLHTEYIFCKYYYTQVFLANKQTEVQKTIFIFYFKS